MKMGYNNFLERKSKPLIIIVACCLLLLTSIYQQINNKQDILSLLQQGEPATAHFKEVKGIYKTYELIDENGNFLSYAVISSASGYGGPITMLTSVSREGTILSVVLIENSETPLYLKKVISAGYPENLHGKEITQPLKNHKDIDVVSGATQTTQGILLAVEKGIYQVGQTQLGLSVPTLKTYHFQWQDGLTVLLLFLAIVAANRNLRKVRPWLLVASVVVLGFMANTSLTIGNFMSIMLLKMPSVIERPAWYLLVVGILAITLLWRKNFYCYWLCPFGAVQEGTYKALNLVSYQPNPIIIVKARKSRWLFLWLAAMLALLFNNPGIASYEPFIVFFSGDGNTAQWIIMGLILLFSILILRFWCRCFCPVGAFLDFLAQYKRKSKKLLLNKPVSEEPLKSTLGSFDKLVACTILAICILILGALLKNSGVF
ncbi:4Fe-4S binding protein [Desulfosporosinus sp.]|uniref:4Fe-4S binding protein n=1 Tax=Desulfosporosinus sp. TaxID=157907 RepID=UPI0025C5813B|nr:4Fe-4S binding protein [Desulfosporosinus sp.]